MGNVEYGTSAHYKPFLPLIIFFYYKFSIDKIHLKSSKYHLLVNTISYTIQQFINSNTVRFQGFVDNRMWLMQVEVCEYSLCQRMPF